MPPIHTPLSSSLAFTALLTRLRDCSTPRAAFVATADRLCRLLAEAALGEFSRPAEVTSPTGALVQGRLLPNPELCAAVSVVRSGDALSAAFGSVEPAMHTGGKLLVQRDEALAHKPAVFLLKKLPPGIAGCERVFLCDPMLASGGSAAVAIRELLESGVEEARIVLVCVVAAPEGLSHVGAAFPGVGIVVGCVDEALNDARFIVPGLGDFGDRYFGTN